MNENENGLLIFPVKFIGFGIFWDKRKYRLGNEAGVQTELEINLHVPFLNFSYPKKGGENYVD